MILLNNHGILQSAPAVPAENFLAVGAFTNYGRYSTRYMASLNLDGSLNTSFDAGTSFNNIGTANFAAKNVVEDSSGNFYVLGSFVSYKGTTANNIIKLFPDGSVDTSFNTGTGFGAVAVNCMAIDSAGKLYVGGAFTTYQGATNNRIIKLNTDGTKDTSFDNTTGFDTGLVYGLYIDAAGKIYAGGSFVNYKAGGALDSYCAGMVKLNTDGSRDYSFSPTVAGFSGLVDSIIAL